MVPSDNVMTTQYPGDFFRLMSGDIHVLLDLTGDILQGTKFVSYELASKWMEENGDTAQIGHWVVLYVAADECNRMLEALKAFGTPNSDVREYVYGIKRSR